VTCELCDARPLTRRHYEDEHLWVADCRSCQVPMVVLREHRARPTASQSQKTRDALTVAADQALGAGSWALDCRARRIPEHAHFHARPCVAPLDPDHRGTGAGHLIVLDAPQRFYHGTTGSLAEVIAREGMRTVNREHVFLTDDLVVARHYAEFRVAEGGNVEAAAVVHCRLPAGWRLLRQPHGPGPLPTLPWLTRLPLANTTEYVSDRAVAARHVERVERWRVSQFDDNPQLLKEFERDSIRFEATFGNPFDPTRPTVRYGVLAQVLPDLRALIEAARREVPLFDEEHSLAVAAAGVRLINAGLPVLGGGPHDMGGTRPRRSSRLGRSGSRWHSSRSTGSRPSSGRTPTCRSRTSST
jgi:hypothetical protein